MMAKKKKCASPSRRRRHAHTHTHTRRMLHRCSSHRVCQRVLTSAGPRDYRISDTTATKKNDRRRDRRFPARPPARCKCGVGKSAGSCGLRPRRVCFVYFVITSTSSSGRQSSVGGSAVLSALCLVCSCELFRRLFFSIFLLAPPAPNCFASCRD